ncbi:hypothetical protein HYC85_025366 [Camellia sinensis]|uniref:Uncharacterized protein n=1 Tax=Camellia sinensis TaxID=4442 RepID=A0A7J7GAU4_CAMSI|nr:hypothetical protein HYC85_025366 [Camellia sinensis]
MINHIPLIPSSNTYLNNFEPVHETPEYTKQQPKRLLNRKESNRINFALHAGSIQLKTISNLL